MLIEVKAFAPPVVEPKRETGPVGFQMISPPLVALVRTCAAALLPLPPVRVLVPAPVFNVMVPPPAGVAICA